MQSVVQLKTTVYDHWELSRNIKVLCWIY